MGALAGRSGRHRARLAGAAAVTLAAGALAAPADAARTKVAWETSGGIAGITAGLTVHADHTGRATQNGETARFLVTRREWSALNERLRAARFRTLERRYAPEARIPDGTLDVVRHRGHTVTVETGGDPPRRLERLLRHLARLHERHAPSR
jgi:hypothetical protein